MTAEELAKRFHETYERLAPDFGYKTREASAVPWGDVPEDNKRLMVAVAGEIIEHLGSTKGGWWCLSHQREATHEDDGGVMRCDPNLGGLLLPCQVVHYEIQSDPRWRSQIKIEELL